jgi:hypothetical protein
MWTFRWLRLGLIFLFVTNACVLLEKPMNSDCNNLSDVHVRRTIAGVELRLVGPQLVCGVNDQIPLLDYALRLQICNATKQDVTVVGLMSDSVLIGFGNRRFWELGNEDEWANVPPGPPDIERLSSGKEKLAPGECLAIEGDPRYMSILQTLMLSGESVSRERHVGRVSPRVFRLEFEYSFKLVGRGGEQIVAGDFETQVTLFRDGDS